MIPEDGRILTCVYCGHEYPQDTPSWGNEVLTDHIERCEKHPMTKTVRQNKILRAAIVDFIGTDKLSRLQNVAELGLRNRGLAMALIETHSEASR